LSQSVPAIKDRNFKPKIFTDITMPAKQSYDPNTGKKSQVLTSPISMGESQCIAANARSVIWNRYHMSAYLTGIDDITTI